MSYLIKDKDGKEVIKNGHNVFGSDIANVIKGVNMEKRTLSITGSTQDPDRDGDIITLRGWELENYLKNPVFLWGHDYGSVPLAAATKVMKKRAPNRLDFVFRFPTKGIFPFADMVLSLYNEKVANASSVGFMALEWEKVDEKDDSWGAPRKFTRQELLELSGVAVPANPHAVQNMMNLSKSFKNGDMMIDYVMGKKYIEIEKDPRAEAEIMELMDKGAEYEEETKVQVQVPEDIKKGDDEEPNESVKVLTVDEYDGLINTIKELQGRLLVLEAKQPGETTSVPDTQNEVDEKTPLEVILETPVKSTPKKDESRNEKIRVLAGQIKQLTDAIANLQK